MSRSLLQNLDSNLRDGPTKNIFSQSQNPRWLPAAILDSFIFMQVSFHFIPLHVLYHFWLKCTHQIHFQHQLCSKMLFSLKIQDGRQKYFETLHFCVGDVKQHTFTCFLMNFSLDIPVRSISGIRFTQNRSHVQKSKMAARSQYEFFHVHVDAVKFHSLNIFI